MTKPWLKHYGDAIPHDVDTSSYRSVVDMLAEAAEHLKDRTAYSSIGCTLTLAETWALARDFAAYLQTELGIQKGDRVAVMLPNMMAFPVAMYGILRAGGVQVNVNPM